MKKSRANKIITAIILLAFLIILMGMIITSIISFVHHVRNPELTIMQAFLWYWHRYKWWLILTIIGYIGLLIVKEKH